MKRHFVVSIAGLERKLASFKRKDQRRLYCYDLFGVDDETLRNEISEMKSKGFTVIPGENCQHNPDGTCPGHEDRKPEPLETFDRGYAPNAIWIDEATDFFNQNGKGKN